MSKDTKLTEMWCSWALMVFLMGAICFIILYVYMEVYHGY